MSLAMKDIVVSEAAYTLLHANGVSDRQRGTDMQTGWREVCKTAGYADQRTPAREAYEDGWYSVTEG